MDENFKKDIYLYAQPVDISYVSDARKRQSVLDGIMRLNKTSGENKNMENTAT